MNTGDKLPLSVALISKNEEDRIGRTLDSISDIASEIILIDSGSTDRTAIIAKKFGAKVFDIDWKGFTDTKNIALERCSQEWILFLDCDEVVTDELRESIIIAVKSGEADAYEINRRSYYLGKTLKRSWQPDKKLRLVHSSLQPIWKGGEVHEYLSVNKDTKSLSGELIHYSYRDLQDHLYRTVRYARLSAQSYRRKGKEFSLMNLLINPFTSFFRHYLIRGSYLDGIRGFLVAFSGFFYTFMKYAFLYEIKLKEKRNKS